MKKVLFIVAAATLFFSCQKEIEPENITSSNRFSFKASIESLSTRADISSGNELLWATGDKIGIFVNDESWKDKNQPFTLESGEGTTTGKFTWDYTGDFSDKAAAAFFPWNGTGSNANNVYDGNVYFKLPGSYGDDVKYTSGQMYTPLVAKLNNSSEVIEFKHVGAAVKVTINNLPVGVHSMGMSVKDQQVYGDYHVAYANAGTDALALDGTADATKNTIWLNITPNETEGEFVFLFPVPTLTAPKLSFQMYDENDVLVWKKNLKAQPVNIERGQVLEMPPLDITPYAQFSAENCEWTVIGTYNGTNWDADLPMVTDGTICIAKGVTFAAGGEFKVRRNKTWGNGNEYPSSNYVVNTAGTYDIFFTIDGGGIELKESVCSYPSAPITSGADGDMSEWASISGTVRTPDSGNAIQAVKAYADEDNIYVYIKRAKMGRYDQVWATGDAVHGDGYYYYDFDLDNNPETGDYTEGSSYEAYCYLYPFGAENVFVASPSGEHCGMSITGVTCAGAVSENAIEVEVAFPRVNFPTISSTTISVTVRGNKDANPRTTVSFPFEKEHHEITIDGDMSDWAKVSGSTTTGIIKAFKMWNDDENFYFYNSCEPGSRGAELWNGGGYYYYDFNLDNDSTTGDYTEGDKEVEPYYEATLAIFPFGGTASEPAINNPLSFYKPKGVSTDGITLKGAITDDLIEVEFVIPRANFETQVQSGDIITVYNWRAKGGNSTTLTYTVQ